MFHLLPLLTSTIDPNLDSSMAAASVSYHPSNLTSHQSRDGMQNGYSNQEQDFNHVHPLPTGPATGSGELRLGAYHIPKPSECLMDWDEICQFIATGDLDDLKRHPKCESEYASWAAPIRKKWGSLEDYIRSYRLGWDRELSSTSEDGGKGSLAIDTSDVEQQQQQPLCFHASMDENMAKCIPNDWPYAIPGDCAHYVVWCRFPIIDASLFSTAPLPTTSSIPFPTGTSRSNLYDCVVQDGVRGLTGQSTTTSSKPKVVIGLGTVSSLLKPSNPISIPKDNQSSSDSPSSKPLSLEEDQDGEAEDKALELAALAHKHAGRFINDYVVKNWNEEDWQTAWFCNPPHLRTVPGLSHFHVIARRKPKSNLE